jgi:hypothetical protein
MKNTIKGWSKHFEYIYAAIYYTHLAKLLYFKGIKSISIDWCQAKQEFQYWGLGCCEKRDFYSRKPKAGGKIQ